MTLPERVGYATHLGLRAEPTALAGAGTDGPIPLTARQAVCHNALLRRSRSAVGRCTLTSEE